MLPIAVLIATTPRPHLLSQQALPSLAEQSHQPDILVVVSDRRALSKAEKESLRVLVASINTVFVTNQRKQGAAGSWNSGLDTLKTLYPDCYVAILDDDDRWHPDHLSSCISLSDQGNAHIVLSGINVVQGQSVLAQNIPQDIGIADFLTGNPGWQGSNTFIRLSTVSNVGGYTDGLISCNDRDFAIRALQMSDLSIKYTGKVTVDWYLNESPDALSAIGSEQKLHGSSQFLKLHGSKMSASQKERFFHRMGSLFGLSRTAIENALSGS